MFDLEHDLATHHYITINNMTEFWEEAFRQKVLKTMAISDSL